MSYSTFIVIESYIWRRNQLNLELTQYQTQRSLANYTQKDYTQLQNTEENSVRDKYKAIWQTESKAFSEANDGKDYKTVYVDYTELPDYQEEIDIITAKYDEYLGELTAWQTALDAQITTASTELQEVNAYLQSFKSMQSSNIQDEFDFGLNG